MKTRTLIAGLLIAALAASLAYGPRLLQPHKAAPGGKGQNVALLGVMKGFEPGSAVSYNIFPEKGKGAGGTAVVDARGNLDLPAYNLHDAFGGRFLNYDIEIQGGEKPLKVTLTFDAATGKIAVLGKGLNGFDTVGFKGAARDIQTKADWAGIVKTTDAGGMDDLGKEDGFKIALGSDIMNDAVPKQNPKVIQVLSAPGGGMFNDPQLNQYDTSTYGCNDGISPGPDYSYCQDGFDDAIDAIVDNYVTALYMMGEQLTAVMAMQMLPVGAMIDAKQQLEAQLALQRLRAEAHKDYQPSTTMCEFGSYIKSITTAEEKTAYEKQAINTILLDFYSDLDGVSSTEGFRSDVNSRVQQFRTVYCDPDDNGNGLNYMCDHDQAPGGPAGGTDRARINKDINFNRTLDQPLTLDVDFAYAHSPGVNTRNPTADEADILALAKNLYWPTALYPGLGKYLREHFNDYLDSRTLLANMGVAHNSYASIAAMKAKTVPGIGAASGWNFMKSMMRDFGLNDAEIDQTLGAYPSYYAQMEVLTKKLYQRPDFYTNLYDKPANVKRISDAMTAIQIMQQRDFFESSLRREMLTSLLVQEALQKHIERINGQVVSEVKNQQK